MKAVLIVGATGVVGEAALDYFAASSHWRAIAISRRTPEAVSAGNFTHIPVDLTDKAACAKACDSLSEVTHIIYGAVAEKPGLVAGWQDREQMQLNLEMLKNLLDPLCKKANLQHISLLQGAKAYGAHVGHIPPVPARESAPRDLHENFYWLQEDYIRQLAETNGFAWTVFRPQVIIGAAHGVVMNPLLPIAAYAAIRREEGKPFSYPGGEIQIAELVDPALLAQAFEWAASSNSARNEIFNFTNGDIFTWRDAWPTMAGGFGVEVGRDEPMRLSQYLVDRTEIWDRIVRKEKLRPISLTDFLGQSHYYADILMRMDADVINRPTLLSTIKIREAGFNGCRDSLDSVRYWISEMQRRRLIPTPMS